IHPGVEEIAISRGKEAKESQEKIVEDFVEGATGLTISRETAGNLFDAANRCGPHAQDNDQSGKNLKISVGKRFTVSVGGEGIPNPQDPPVAQALEGDCAVKVG